MTIRVEDHRERKRKGLACHMPCSWCSSEKAAAEYALTMREVERLEKRVADARRTESELAELHRALKMSVAALSAAVVRNTQATRLPEAAESPLPGRGR